MNNLTKPQLKVNILKNIIFTRLFFQAQKNNKKRNNKKESFYYNTAKMPSELLKRIYNKYNNLINDMINDGYIEVIQNKSTYSNYLQCKRFKILLTNNVIKNLTYKYKNTKIIELYKTNLQNKETLKIYSDFFHKVKKANINYQHYLVNRKDIVFNENSKLTLIRAQHNYNVINNYKTEFKNINKFNLCNLVWKKFKEILLNRNESINTINYIKENLENIESKRIAYYKKYSNNSIVNKKIEKLILNINYYDIKMYNNIYNKYYYYFRLNKNKEKFYYSIDKSKNRDYNYVNCLPLYLRETLTFNNKSFTEIDIANSQIQFLVKKIENYNNYTFNEKTLNEFNNFKKLVKNNLFYDFLCMNINNILPSKIIENSAIELNNENYNTIINTKIDRKTVKTLTLKFLYSKNNFIRKSINKTAEYTQEQNECYNEVIMSNFSFLIELLNDKNFVNDNLAIELQHEESKFINYVFKTLKEKYNEINNYENFITIHDAILIINTINKENIINDIKNICKENNITIK